MLNINITRQLIKSRLIPLTVDPLFSLLWEGVREGTGEFMVFKSLKRYFDNSLVWTSF
jgi:hypothetical protein